jgi:hypothetical protein
MGSKKLNIEIALSQPSYSILPIRRMIASAPREAIGETRSVSGFASVADCQYHDLFSVVVIQGDIGPESEVNHPLAELRRQLIDRRANLRVLRERFHAKPDCLDGTLGSIPAFGN